MIDDRNKSIHDYDEDLADAMYVKIRNEYYPAFIELFNALRSQL